MSVQLVALEETKENVSSCCWLAHVARVHPSSVPNNWDSGTPVSVVHDGVSLGNFWVVLDEFVAEEKEVRVDQSVLSYWQRQQEGKALDNCQVELVPWHTKGLVQRVTVQVLAQLEKTGWQNITSEEDLNESLRHIDLGKALNRKVRGLGVCNFTILFVQVLGLRFAIRVVECSNDGFIGRKTHITVQFPGHSEDESETIHSSAAGLEDCFETLKMNIIAKTRQRTSLLAPHAIALLGPHGSGKSYLLRQVRDLALPVQYSWLDCARLVLEAEGGPTFQVKASRALDVATNRLSVVLVDNLDALVTSSMSRGAEACQSTSQQAVTNWLCSLLYQANSRRQIILAAATSDSFQRLPRRLKESTSPYGFPAKVEIKQPTQLQREDMLSCMLVQFGLVQSTQLAREWAKRLAPHTPGFVAGDLHRLCARTRARARLSGKAVDMDDLVQLAALVRPSQFGRFDVCPPSNRQSQQKVKEKEKNKKTNPFDFEWTGIGGYEAVKNRLAQLLSWNQRHPENAHRGILLHGPSGCGKTMLANAIAREANVNFLSVKASDLTSMYLGESERLVRELFSQAQRAAPCIVFLDEIDAIGGARQDAGSVSNRMVGALLNEMDGVGGLQHVTLLAATNRLDMMDAALLRPGRLGTQVYVPLPDTENRKGVLQACTSAMLLAEDVDLDELAVRTEGLSCAEVNSVCVEAAMLALRESIEFSVEPLCVAAHHFVLC